MYVWIFIHVKWKTHSYNTFLHVLMYSNHLNIGLVWYSNGRFVSGSQMVRYSNVGLKTRLKKPVYGPKCSGSQMVCQVTWLYHLNTRHPYCLVFMSWVFRWSLYNLFNLTLFGGYKKVVRRGLCEVTHNFMCEMLFLCVALYKC